MWLNLQFLANLFTFTEEILNGKLNFLWSDSPRDETAFKVTWMIYYEWLLKDFHIILINSINNSYLLILWIIELLMKL